MVPIETDFFVVQMCWFSGPHTFEPIDYPRLFGSADSAQALAHQSAHLLSRNQQHQAVRTIPLTTSFGFSVAGALFWVRRVRGRVDTATNDNNPSSSVAYALCHKLVVGTKVSRRVQAEQDCELCVFSTPEMAHAAAQSYAAVVQVRQLPLGPPPSSYEWWQDWPSDRMHPVEGWTNSKREKEVTASTTVMEEEEGQHRPQKRACVQSRMELG